MKNLGNNYTLDFLLVGLGCILMGMLIGAAMHQEYTNYECEHTELVICHDSVCDTIFLSAARR